MVVFPIHKHFGHDILVGGFLKGTARSWIQVADFFGNILHLINPHSQSAGNLRKPATAQSFHVLLHNLVLQRFHPTEALQLQQQTFA